MSTDNIKVENMPRGKVLSFVVAPHFDQVLQFDGKTTYQMKRLPGKRVKVYYDERALAICHADRIVVINARLTGSGIHDALRLVAVRRNHGRIV